MCYVQFSIWIPCMQQWALSHPRVHFIWHVMHYLVTFPSWGLRRSHPSLENSNGTACNDTMHPPSYTPNQQAGDVIFQFTRCFITQNEPPRHHNIGLTHSHINQALFVMLNYCGHLYFHQWHVNDPMSDITQHYEQGRFKAIVVNPDTIYPGLNFHVICEICSHLLEWNSPHCS